MGMIFRALPVFLAAGLCLTGAGCRRPNLLSTSEEVRIGQQASRQIEQQHRVETNSAAANRVRRLGERLLAVIDERQGVPYTFKVIDEPVVNAVSLPGGPVYVYKGLLDLVGDNDDELAAVIGHEIAHVEARHAAKQISAQIGTNILLQVVLKGGATQDIAGLGAQLLQLNYSREDEYESDRRSISYLRSAAFDPRGLIGFFRKLAAREQRGGAPEFLRTHPVTQSRIDRAEAIIARQ